MTSTKKELKRKENQERLMSAVTNLDIITKNKNIPRNVRSMVKEALDALMKRVVATCLFGQQML
jgi:uncharacterized protein (UPF0147 family)